MKRWINVIGTLIFLVLFASPIWAATLFVDSYPGSNCSGNYNPTTRVCSGGSYNSYTTPNLAYAASSVGDTIYIRQGTYNLTSSLLLEKANQIWKKYLSDTTPVLDGTSLPSGPMVRFGATDQSANYILWDGIDIHNAPNRAMHIQYYTTGTTIKNSTIYNTHTFALLAQRTKDTLIEDVIFDHSQMCASDGNPSDCEAGVVAPTVGISGVEGSTDWGNNSIFRRCTFKYSFGTHLLPDRYSSDTTVEYSIFYNSARVNLYTNMTRNLTIRYNLFYQDIVDDTYWFDGTRPGCNIVIGEECTSGGTYPCTDDYNHGYYIYGNMVAGGSTNIDMWNSGVHDLHDIYIYNNSFINAHDPRVGWVETNVKLNDFVGTPVNWIFKNNIVWQDENRPAIVDSGFIVGSNFFDRAQGDVDSNIQGVGDIYGTNPQMSVTTNWTTITAGSLDGSEFEPLRNGNLVDKVAGIINYTTLPLGSIVFTKGISVGDATQYYAFGYATTPVEFGAVQVRSMLAIHPSNARLFVGMDGSPLTLFGHQVFSEVADHMLGNPGTMGPSYPNQQHFDSSWYISWMLERKMNYVRGWSTFSTAYPIGGGGLSHPLPYSRTGPGNANDGLPKFNLSVWDESYFTRLRDFVALLQANNIYYSCMLFEPTDFSLGGFYPNNVFKSTNNTAGVEYIDHHDGNTNHGMDFFYTPSTTLLNMQKLYVNKVIDTLNEFDNVIWEVANELGNSTWQHDMVDYIREYESGKSKQHLILVAPGGITATAGWSAMSKSTIKLTGANIYSVSKAASWALFGNTISDPALITNETTLTEPLIIDTDHIDAENEDGYNKDPRTSWKAFLRGYHFSLYDDPFNGWIEGWDDDDSTWEAVRKNIGLIAYYANNSLDLANLVPSTSTSICSTGYVRYKDGSEYFAMQPLSGNFSIYLPAGDYKYDWVRINTGTVYSTDNTVSSTGGFKTFIPPITNEPFAVYVHLIPGIGQSACAQWYTTYYLTSDDIPPSVITKLGSLTEAQQNIYLRAGYLDVTLYDGVGSYHVDKTGVNDSTTGLQKALEDANTYQLVAFFPSGTYKVSNTLRIVVKRCWYPSKTGVCNASYTYPLIIEGSSFGDRPVIKLADSSTGFSNASSPRPIIHICQAVAKRVEGADCNINPEYCCSNDPDCMGGPNCNCDIGMGVGMNNSISNINIDVGSGNPGALGLRMNHAQGSFIRDMKVYSYNGSPFVSGFKDIPHSGGGAVNIEVDGGQYGLVTGSISLNWSYGSGNSSNQGMAWPIVVNAKFTNQTGASIMGSYSEGPITFVGLEIQKATSPAIYTTSTGKNGQFIIWDGKIEITNGGSSAAIWQNANSSIYINNVYVKGVTTVANANGNIVTCTGNCTNNWTKISELAYSGTSMTDCEGRPYPCPTYNFINGVKSNTFFHTTVQNSGKPPANIALQHKLTVPYFEDPDAVNVRDLPTGQCAYGDVGWYVSTSSDPYYWIKYVYPTCTQDTYNSNQCTSPTPTSSHDDTTAIQNAINTYDKVFLPKGFYRLSNTLTLRTTSKFFGAGSSFSFIAPSETWNPGGVETPVVTTVNDPEAETYLGSITALTPWTSLNWQWFNLMNWKAGRNSVVFNYSAIGDVGYKSGIVALPGNPIAKTKFSGNGGGRWYFGWVMHQEAGQRTGNADYRGVLIDGTIQPLTIYGFNMEHIENEGVHAEVRNAKNVRIFSGKRETREFNAYLINNSENIVFSSDGGHGVPDDTTNNFIMKVHDSDKVVVTSFVNHGGQHFNAWRVVEEIGSSPQGGVHYNEYVGVYKRGTLDTSVWQVKNKSGYGKIKGLYGSFR